MVYIGADGKMQIIKNVLGMETFLHIRPGMTKGQVLRILGHSDPSEAAYFKARDELVWEWRYCDEWNEPARFDVLFESKTDVVSTTLSRTESQRELVVLRGIAYAHTPNDDCSGPNDIFQITAFIMEKITA